MLMLLSVHVTSVLFLVQFNNFALLLELHAHTLVARSYALLIVLLQLISFSSTNLQMKHPAMHTVLYVYLLCILEGIAYKH